MKLALIRAGVVAVGSLTALALGTTAAVAAPTYSVSAGNAAAGAVVPATATTQGASPQVTFVNTTTNTTLNCASSTLKMSTTVGTGLAPQGIATVLGGQAGFTNCTGPLGLTFDVKGQGTWKLTVNAGNAAGASGNLTNIKARVTSTPNASTCSFTVTGLVAGSYTNATQILAAPGLTSGLKVSNTTGCFGLVNNGDVASYKADYKVVANSAPKNPIAITKP